MEKITKNTFVTLAAILIFSGYQANAIVRKKSRTPPPPPKVVEKIVVKKDTKPVFQKTVFEVMNKELKEKNAELKKELEVKNAELKEYEQLLTSVIATLESQIKFVEAEFEKVKSVDENEYVKSMKKFAEQVKKLLHTKSKILDLIAIQKGVKEVKIIAKRIKRGGASMI